MFAVEWLKQGVTVERETSALANLADAVATARARAEAVVARHAEGDDPVRTSDPRQERLSAQLTSFHCEFRRLYCGRWRATICRAKCYVEKPDIVILVSHEDHPRRSRRMYARACPVMRVPVGRDWLSNTVILGAFAEIQRDGHDQRRRG